MDVVKICEVVDGCEDCPKYGDDCDGDKRTESTDRISRADAIEAVAQQWLFEASVGNPYVNDDDIGEYRKLAEELFEDVPSAEAVQEAVPTVVRVTMSDGSQYYLEHERDAIQADAEGDDLIIKGAKGIKDGLYNITDGKLFKYKANGGTVRTYPIVPSADAKQGEWIEKYNGNGWNDFWDYTCSNCGKKYERADAVLYHANYCPNCGARMKGGAE